VSTSVRRPRSSPGILTIGLIALGGVAALFAVGFAAFIFYKHFLTESKPAITATTAPAAPSPSATPLSAATDVLQPLADPNHFPSSSPSPAGETAAPASSHLVLTSPSVAASAPPPAQSEQKTEAVPSNSAKQLSKAARRALEKERQTAERKRARLEEMYQNHEISTEAYNKGEREYREEIQKYRSEINSD
jgi:cytoskeletal protein RodZ